MGKRDKKTKKGKGAEKTTLKTNKKLEAKQKKLLQKLGEQDIVEVVARLEAEEARLKTVTETVCPPPTPRSNFTMCAHPGDRDELLLFGGEFYNGSVLTLYNDLFVYSVPKNEWKTVRSPAGPAPRCSHQMVATANDGGQLWIFGGEHPSPSQSQFFHYRDLWCYRLADKKWEKIAATGGPSARSGHRMVALKKRLYVFGGFYDAGTTFQYFNDVWCFSLETYTWHEIKCEVPFGSIRPAPRSAGSMAATPDGRLLVWGGYSRTSVKKDVDRGVTHSDMFALTQDKKDATGLTWKWSTVKAGGGKPVARSGVGLTVTQAGLAYTFGGVLDVDEDEETVDGHFSNDMHSFDLAKHVWRLVELKEPAQPKASGKKSKSGDDDTMVEAAAEAPKTVSDDGVFTMVVGGGASSSLFATGSDGKARSKANSVGNVPSPRMKATLVVCKKQLYLFGGIVEDGNKQFTLADFYSLDLGKLDGWKTIVGKEANSHEWMESEDEADSGSGGDDDSDESDESDSDEDSDEMDTD